MYASLTISMTSIRSSLRYARHFRMKFFASADTVGLLGNGQGEKLAEIM